MKPLAHNISLNPKLCFSPNTSLMNITLLHIKKELSLTAYETLQGLSPFVLRKANFISSFITYFIN